MDQLKFSLGPYELFSSILGGMPLLFAIFLFYSPVSSLEALIPIVQKNSSVAIATTLLFISYILGGAVQDITWKYFERLCLIFNHDFRSFGRVFKQKSTLPLPQSAQESAQEGDRLTLQTNENTLNFDQALEALLRAKIGDPTDYRFLEFRIIAYLREHKKQASLSAAELHMANHIMYRSWSFGFCLLGIVLLINLFRTPTHPFEQWMLPIASFTLTYLTFFRALRFKRWNFRELLLGSYFAASNVTVQSRGLGQTGA